MSYEVKFEPVVHIRLTQDEVNIIYSALIRGNTLERTPREPLRQKLNLILEQMAVMKNKDNRNMITGKETK